MTTKNKREGGVYAPEYYSAFKCIADKCRHSCCIDWEICIDDATYEKYKRTEDILSTVRECEDGPCFALTEEGRCPHLNADGLCNIILSHGEELLCDICNDHPRFYNYLNGGRMEVGLGIVCEEACRLILEDKGPFSLIKIDELEDDDAHDGGFDPLPQRDDMLRTIEGPGSFSEKISALKNKYKIPSPYTADEWLDRLLSLEVLDRAWTVTLEGLRGKLLYNKQGEHRELDGNYKRLLVYFIYRHVSSARSERELRARLGFCILSAEVIRSVFICGDEHTVDGLIDCAGRYSAEIEYSEDNTEELILAFM